MHYGLAFMLDSPGLSTTTYGNKLCLPTLTNWTDVLYGPLIPWTGHDTILLMPTVQVSIETPWILLKTLILWV
jgi:hypothetical protein